MAKSIANFLVGIGLDTRDFQKGARLVDTSLSSFRSRAGLAGGALAAAFSAAGLAAVRAGNRVDQLSLSSEKFSTSARFVNDYGNALRMLGGNASDAVAAIGAAEAALDNLRLKGEMGSFQDAVFAGVDISQLTGATSGEDFLRRLSAIVPDLSKDQQRLLQDAFGFSDATMRSLRDGQRSFDSMVASAAALSGDFEKAVEAARAYNVEIAKMGVTFDGIGNSLAAKILPSFTGILQGINQFISANGGKIDASIDYLAKNGMATSGLAGSSALIAGGAGLSMAGGAAGSAKLAAAGRMAAMGGWLGVAAAGTSLLWNLDADDIEAMTGYDVSKYYQSPAKSVSSLRDWWRGGAVSASEAAQQSPEVFRRMSSANEVPSITIPELKNNLQVRVDIAGKPLENAITQVIERREADTIEDVQSSVAR